MTLETEATLAGFPDPETAELVARFGRFPHRNEILGRPNTPDEDAFLADRD